MTRHRGSDDFNTTYIYSVGPSAEWPREAVELLIRDNPHQTLLTWPAWVQEAQLESSSDLVHWETVGDMTEANFYEIKDSGANSQRHYRLRYERSE